MKIVGISGSPNEDGNSAWIVGTCLGLAEGRGFEVERVDPASLDVAPCSDCGTCRDEKGCSIADDMVGVYDLLEGAEGFFVVSPVYFGTLTAQLKAFFDRTLPLRRAGFALKNKVGGAAAVGGSRNGGQEITIQTIHAWMHIHGMIVVGDDSHFGGALQRAAADDVVGMETARATINKICDTIELIGR
ncbi:iron-sulfur protein [Methanosarcinales archaeon ex4572_44]|nr:MAG: iron-sulfur protein [Methanosarcinales archaeon ex4484_138]PHP45482.1 MAG: iron-sulfur protein [Methanosarcinales archaeon ex4572_44]HHI30831.1 flavodoxin family protein [Candidatus Methanoperedenaceae archaeon]